MKVCGKQCHDAKTSKCRCWCGGTFHGAEGEAARATFAATFTLARLPSTEKAFNHLTHPNLFHADATSWRDRVADAVATLTQATAAKKTRKKKAAQAHE